MILPIVKYGHPILRQKGATITAFDEDLQKLIEDMFETMYHAAGVGLAAQQIGHALQLTVIDVRDIPDRPSSLFLQDQPADVNTLMPLTLINPEIRPQGDPVSGPEGCLSFPEIYEQITRPEWVQVRARDRRGAPLEFKAGGLLSRAIQHEVDHLNGILFIDRMTSVAKHNLKPQLEQLRKSTLDSPEKTKSNS